MNKTDTAKSKRNRSKKIVIWDLVILLVGITAWIGYDRTLGRTSATGVGDQR